jgi:methyl-accepting chemotaxis protein
MKLNIKNSVFAFSLLTCLTISYSLLVTNGALNHLSMNGPIFSDINKQKDLIADILPPPLYVVEAYGLAYEGAFHEERRAEDIAKIKALEASFNDRIAYWKTVDMPDDERLILETKVQETAAVFWKIMINDLLPVMSEGYEVTNPVFDRLSLAYADQKSAILELNALAQKKMEDIVSQASVSTRHSIYEATGSGVLTLALCIAGVMAIIQWVIRPLSTMTAFMTRLSTGDTSHEVPYAKRSDEIGSMSTAVSVFRQSLIDNVRIDRETQDLRLRAEADRIAADERADRVSAERMRIATSGLKEGLRRLAGGDLTVQLTETFAEDFELLRHDFNAAVSQLCHTLTNVAYVADHIDSGSRDVADGSSDMARRTEQQAAALEETASALEQITVNVKNAALRADEARHVAFEANQSAARSGAVVDQAVGAMSRIEQSSSQINNIIGVIDEIAFQTNLLALNAGVEAARAGDAGKGFAVVAQEVRELAQRSAQAAKEIKGLIHTSSSEVANGVKLVSETGDVLKSIGSLIITINEQMDAITVSTREQSAGLAEVNSAVIQMDQTTQQNASMVAETSAASAKLADESKVLRDLISQFDLDLAPVKANAFRQAS